MATIIQRSHSVECIEHHLFFEDKDCPGAGKSFECSPNGDVLVPEHQAARDNLAHCLANPDLYNGPYVENFTRTVTFGPVVKCDCGRKVYCESHYENDCECGREYNRSGQLLAPRSQWGSEWTTKPEEDYGYY